MTVASSTRYAVLETKDLVETHRLIDQERNAEVVVAPGRGGMVTRFRVGDDDILFLDQATLRDHNQSVRGGIPVLFPIAGRLTGDEFRLEGESIPMAQHGFARRVPWRVTATDAANAASITMALEHSEATLATWPFRFRLVFRYELRDATLAIHQRYENLGDRPMPIHPGLHPYFRVEDWSKRQARVVTAATRVFDNRTGETLPLAAAIEFGSGELDLQILDHGQPGIRLDRPGACAVQLAYDDASTVVTLWTLPSRDFVCVEPWSRQADALNRGDALSVPPGGAHNAVLTISPQLAPASSPPGPPGIVDTGTPAP